MQEKSAIAVVDHLQRGDEGVVFERTAENAEFDRMEVRQVHTGVPAYAAFLLIAEAAGQLLPTVRSRCEQLSLVPPVEESAPPSQEAVTLADLLTAGRESTLLAHCVGLEKLSREEWTVLLTDTILELERRARTDLSQAGAILPRIDHLKTLRAACDFNVGAGHLAGWLCAGNV